MKKDDIDFKETDLFLDMHKPYLRPPICKGDYRLAKAILIGINPASPIFPKDIEIKDYIKLCSDYSCFMEFYKKSRKDSGKAEISRTRKGILSFVKWLNSSLDINVIETDIFTYPTSSIKELNKIPKIDLLKSRTLFWESILSFTQCELIILYGSLTLKYFIELLIEKEIDWKVVCNLGIDNIMVNELSKFPIEYLEVHSPILEVEISNKKMVVFVVRHLMYYGETGNSYELVKKNIFKFWKESRREFKD